MAKISELPAADAITGSEELLLVQAGAGRRGSLADVFDAVLAVQATQRDAYENRIRSLFSQPSSGAALSAFAMAASPTFADASKADDSGSGLTLQAAKKTLDAAYLAGAAYSGLVVRGNGSSYEFTENSHNILNRHTAALGGNAIMDARDEIGLTASGWTDDGDDCWYKVVDLDEITEADGPDSDLTNDPHDYEAANNAHFAIWIDGQLKDWVYYGATIAENEGDVRAGAPLRFSLNTPGSIEPDPRDDDPATQVRIFIKLDPARTPADYSIKITSKNINARIYGGSISNFTFIGHHGKDAMGASVQDGIAPTLNDCSWLDTPVHGPVGVYNTAGVCVARSRGIEGVTSLDEKYHYWSKEYEGETVERRLATGWGFHHYTDTYHPEIDINHETLIAENYASLFGAHTSANDQGVRSISVGTLLVRNGLRIVDFTSLNGYSFADQFIRIGDLYAEWVDNGFSPSGNLYVENGQIQFSDARQVVYTTAPDRRYFTSFQYGHREARVHEFRNLTWSQPQVIANYALQVYHLVQAQTGTNFVNPLDGKRNILRFIDCEDRSPVNAGFYLPYDATTRPLELHLYGSKISRLSGRRASEGSPTNQAATAARTGLAKIVAKGGSVMEWKGMNRADALANMDVVGIEHDIDADTIFLDYTTGLPVA